MDGVKRQISTTQIVFLLLISKAFAVLNYIPIFTNNFSLTALLIANIICMGLALLLIIPLNLFQKKYQNQPIILVAINKNKVFGYIVGGGFLLFVMLNIMGALVGFTFFMTNAIFPNSSSIFIIATIAITCFISALNGIEGLARCGTVVFIIMFVGVAFIIIVATKSVDLTNIRPILVNPAQDILSATSYTISRFTELFVLILLSPNVKGSMKKSGIIFILAATVFMELVTFYIASVLGDYAYSQTFPYYTLASIIETNMLQRLDSVHMAIWVFISFMRITLYMLAANVCMNHMFPKVRRLASFSLITVICSIPAALLVNSPRIIKQISSSAWYSIFTLVAVVPLMLLIKTKKEKLKDEESYVVPASDSDSAV